MAMEFTMPQLGLTMTEGTVSKWLKNVGDAVAAGDLLVEISTDKITNEVEATTSGTLLKLLVCEGETVSVKAPLAIIGEPGEEVASSSACNKLLAAEVVMAPPAAPAPIAREAGEWVKASPLARKLARERHLDLAAVTATGPNGRVVERDIVKCSIPQSPLKATPLATKMAAELGVDLEALDRGQRITSLDVVAGAQAPSVSAGQAQIPVATASPGAALSGMRKVIAERMALSWQTVPHVHLTVQVDMSEAVRLKNKLAESGLKISFTDFVARCAAQTLAAFRMVNNSLVDGKLIENPAINLGIAVAVENGLMVPVIRDADQKSLRRISEEIGAIGAKARAGKLLPDDYSGGTFTVSNLGMYGVDHFTPIIYPPQSAILGVCRLHERPVVIDSVVTVRPMMDFVLAFDHRLIDGALAAQFMARLRQYMEQPSLLL